MKILMITFLLFTVLSIEARSQNLADVARAERKRQQSIQSKTELQKLGDAPAAVYLPPPAPAAAAPEKEVTFEQKLQNERVELIRKRSALLIKLDQVKDDPEAAKAIEAQLIDLSKHAEELKLQHLGKDGISKD